MTYCNIKDAVCISNMCSLNNYPKNKLLKHYKKSDKSSYYLLKYDKNFFNKNDIYIGIYHSVLFSFPNKKLLSFCPSKLITFKYFKNLFPVITNKINIVENVEGIFVQLFFDENIDEWEICDKDNVGCSDVVSDDYKKRTIKQLFISVLGGFESDSLNNLNSIKDFPKEFCYTFKIKKINYDTFSYYRLYLIGVHQIHCELPHYVKYIPESNYETWDCIKNIKDIIYFPKKYFFQNYSCLEEYIEYYNDVCKLIIINEETGVKSFLQSNLYYIEQNFKNKSDFDKYLFFCLHRIYKPYEMYNAYPNYQNQLYGIKQNYESLITCLYQAYIFYFIKKSSVFLPEKYSNHLLFIHKSIYLESLSKRKPEYIRRGTIKKYLDDLSPNEIMHLFLS